MAISSLYEQTGISITVQEALVGYYSGYHDTLAEQINAYSHKISAIGGYDEAAFTLNLSQLEIEDWLARGLGRHIEVFNFALVKVWEGFVNELSINLGPLSVIHGPLLEVGNRVSLYYSTVDTSTNPPTVGIRDVVGPYNDATSQAVYGIIPKILSTGGSDATRGAILAQSYLAEHDLPETGKTFNNQSASQPSITVRCRGYRDWLNYPYNSTTTGLQNASTKITSILAATPNSTWLIYGTTNIDTNTVQVKAWENDNNIAWNLIKGITAKGGTSYERWLFGVYNNREVYYQAAPTTLEYIQRLTEPLTLETTTGEIVYPWDARPGMWLLFSDFLVGRSEPANLREDQRAMFIESVTYSAPYGLQLTGAKIGTLDQRLAQYGLSGIGA